MKENLPRNKIIVTIFLVVIIVTAGLLLTLFLSQNTSNIFKKSSPSVSPTPKEILTSIDEDFSQDAKKIINRNNNTVFYALDAILVGNLELNTQTKIVSGRFYFINDAAKNIFNFSLMNYDDKYYSGIYSNGLRSSSTWQYITFKELSVVAKTGTKVEIRVSLIPSLDGSGDKITRYDNIFRLLKNGGVVDIPKDFVFEASSIGFSDK